MAQSIGERIKSLRTEQGLTLAELGEKSNLSTSYLSQIERDRTTPSLATLTVVARALNVGLRYFFENEAESVYVVRSDYEVPNDRAPGASAHQQLAPSATSNKLTVSRISVEPHGSSGQIPTFAGEEMIFVLKGNLDVVVGDESFTLAAGDSIHYDAEKPHFWSNDVDEPCVMIWSRVVSPLERRSPSEKEETEVNKDPN